MNFGIARSTARAGTTAAGTLPPASSRTRVVAETMTAKAEFGAFYNDNIASLTRTFTAALGDPAVAADAAQESMARAWEQWGKIGGYDNPAGWCYRVGMNWATSRWRKRKREVLNFDDVRPAQVVDHLTGLDDALVRALLKLPLDQREVVVLRLIMDWSIAETAEALGVADGTVQSRYSRALKRLRTDLGNAYD